MITFDPKYLFVSSCESLLPSYKEHLKKTNSNDVKDPLDSLRKIFARMVEEKFKKNGEATLVIGCMHYPQDAEESFVQTQTLLSDLNPRKIDKQENHSHPKAVTIDMRCSPDEVMEYQLSSAETMFLPSSFPPVHPHGPDFARRNFSIISHIEDFKHVKGIKKIYLERIPDFEKGPTSQNLKSLEAMHKLLDKGGILAFDYSPFYNIFSSDRKEVTYNQPLPDARPIKNEEIDQLAKVISMPGIQHYVKNSGLKCSHKDCSSDPCEELVKIVAKDILQAKVHQERLSAANNKGREIVKSKPQAKLENQELLIKAGGGIFTLADFMRSNPLALSLQPTGIAISCGPKRTVPEMESLRYQVECFRSLPLNPDLENDINPDIKKRLDICLVNLVNKVVSPLLDYLGFEKTSIDLKISNQENGRKCNRVIYAQKK
jgi:hypothetical protein